MAKSIRSKRKIKMRNEKRKKVYGPKEMERLKGILGLDKPKDEQEMTDLVTGMGTNYQFGSRNMVFRP